MTARCSSASSCARFKSLTLNAALPPALLPGASPDSAGQQSTRGLHSPAGAGLADHPLRAIRSMIDFSFVCHEVVHCYGYNASLCSTTDPGRPLRAPGQDRRLRRHPGRATSSTARSTTGAVWSPIRRDLGWRGDRVNRFAGDALRSERVEWVGLDSRHLSRLDAR